MIFDGPFDTYWSESRLYLLLCYRRIVILIFQFFGVDVGDVANIFCNK